MSRARKFFVSVTAGFTIATVFHIAAFSIDNRTILRALLWPDALFLYLIGPGPVLFVDKQGNPQYEGTPILVLILPVGYILSVLIYSTVTFLVLKLFLRRRADIF
jgi:hypothetical protein